MDNSANDKRAAFIQRIKVNPSQIKSVKQGQFTSNNKGNSNSNNGNKGSAPARGKALGGGRGNER